MGSAGRWRRAQLRRDVSREAHVGTAAHGCPVERSSTGRFGKSPSKNHRPIAPTVVLSAKILHETLWLQAGAHAVYQNNRVPGEFAQACGALRGGQGVGWTKYRRVVPSSECERPGRTHGRTVVPPDLARSAIAGSDRSGLAAAATVRVPNGKSSGRYERSLETRRSAHSAAIDVCPR